MSVFVVAVLMAGLGLYWGSQSHAAGTARPAPLGLLLPTAIYLAVVGGLLVPILGHECPRAGTPTFRVCEMVKGTRVDVYLILAAGALALSAGAYLGGRRRARWWLLALWPLPLLASMALV